MPDSNAKVQASVDPARERAIYHSPKVAFKRPIPPVEPWSFEHERDLAFAPEAPTGAIVLDRSAELGCDWPATLPNILARYIVVRAGQEFSHEFKSNGETYYVITGNGVSENGDDPIHWQAGDAFCLKGGCATRHSAKEHAILFVSTNEPELRYAGAEPGQTNLREIRPTLFTKADVDRHLEAVQAADNQEAAGKAVILVTRAMQDRRVATPAISITFNTLEPGGDQRPHKHSSAALTLCIQGDDVHSLVDGGRVDWSTGLVMLTPPGAVHSHHNRGVSLMKSFVVQDSPIHAQMRTTGFQFC
jgi:gentisate 1,2-dioxygenase